MPSRFRAAALAAFFALFVLLPYRTSKPHAAADLVLAYGHVVQARMALEEGQFPARTGPWEWGGLQYPVFQFYSPLVYTALGGVDLLLRDPWWTIRLTLWLALFAAGLGAYRLASAISGNEYAAYLGMAVYMLLPYLAINIQARGAVAETFGQCLLPWCALFLWNLLNRPSPRAAAAFALGVAALILTHLISAAYFLITAGFLLSLYTLLSRRVSWVPWFATGCLGAFGISAWTLWPIAATSAQLVASGQASGVHLWSFLTPLSTILSPISNPPPQGPVEILGGLAPAFGWFALTAYALLFRRAVRERCAPFVALASTVAILLFLTWSPFDIWKYLPGIFSIMQFSYRLLAQLGWLAIPAFAWGVQPYLNQLHGRMIAVFIFAAMLLDLTFLHRRNPELDLRYLDSAPSLGYGRDMYLPRALNSSTLLLNGAPLALSDQRGMLRLDRPFVVDAELMRQQPEAILKLTVSAAKPAVLDLQLNSRGVARYSVGAEPSTIHVPFGALFDQQHGMVTILFMANEAVRVYDSELANARDDGRLVTEAGEACETRGAVVRCKIMADQQGWWQLPILYYQDLLSVTVDGGSVGYRSSPWQTDSHLTPLAAIELQPGDHSVTARFRGSRAADWVTLLSLAITGLALVLGRSAHPDPRTFP